MQAFFREGLLQGFFPWLDKRELWLHNQCKTKAKGRNMTIHSTEYRGLDLVAVAADGTFAAYCVVWFDEANRIGMFGPVGTHRAHRQRGLGKALLGEGLRQLEALNANKAYADSGLDRAANRLYESAGFIEFTRGYHWQKRF